MDDPFGLPFEDLPDELSIFPLPGVLLLPGGRLPLNIFEPRYLNMIFDSLGEERLIGMIQPIEYAADPVPESAALMTTGCAGRIVSFTESGDGRLLITLEGLCRFKLLDEQANRNGYRRISPDFDSYSGDMLEQTAIIDRDKLFDTMRNYFPAKGINVDWDAMEKAEDRLLIASLGMMCPFGGPEKQALLDSADIGQMSEIIISLMEMAVRGDDQSSARH